MANNSPEVLSGTKCNWKMAHPYINEKDKGRSEPILCICVCGLAALNGLIMWFAVSLCEPFAVYLARLMEGSCFYFFSLGSLCVENHHLVSALCSTLGQSNQPGSSWDANYLGHIIVC